MFEKENLLEIMHPMLSLNPFYSYVERLKDVEQNVAAFLGNALVDVGTLGISLSALVEIIMELLEQVADDLYHHNTDTVDLLTTITSIISPVSTWRCLGHRSGCIKVKTCSQPSTYPQIKPMAAIGMYSPLWMGRWSYKTRLPPVKT